jgi:hypothetical protein
LIHGRGRDGNDGRETRRKLFLKKVREEGEEKRWRERSVNGGPGEEEIEIMRCIWVAEERRREERRKSEAMGLDLIGDEYELSLGKLKWLLVEG